MNKLLIIIENNKENIFSLSLFITFIVTILSGIFIFILQKIVDRLILEPIQKIRDVIEEISVDLIKYAKFYANPLNISYEDILSMPNDRKEIQIRDYENASDKTRELSARLRIYTHNVPFKSFLYKINLLKIKEDDLLGAADKLMLLSNCYFNSGLGASNSDTADEIREKLNIKL
jgi:hypothetical protein